MKMTEDNFEYDINVNVKGADSRIVIQSKMHCEDPNFGNSLTSSNMINALLSAIVVVVKSQDLEEQGRYYRMILERLEGQFLSPEQWEDSEEFRVINKR